jgi:hypothetical protein
MAPGQWSGVHAAYLARGGTDFLIGDGRLQYGPEYVAETYYRRGLVVTFDLQHVANPAYDQDPSPRLHLEIGWRSRRGP